MIGVRGFALPHGEPFELYADGDRWTTDPLPGATVIAEGWIIPGAGGRPHPSGRRTT